MESIPNTGILLESMTSFVLEGFAMFCIMLGGIVGYSIYLAKKDPIRSMQKKKGNGSLQSEEYDDGTKGEIEITIKIEKDESEASSTESLYR